MTFTTVVHFTIDVYVRLFVMREHIKADGTQNRNTIFQRELSQMKIFRWHFCANFKKDIKKVYYCDYVDKMDGHVWKIYGWTHNIGAFFVLMIHNSPINGEQIIFYDSKDYSTITANLQTIKIESNK